MMLSVCFKMFDCFGSVVIDQKYCETCLNMFTQFLCQSDNLDVTRDETEMKVKVQTLI